MQFHLIAHRNHHIAAVVIETGCSALDLSWHFTGKIRVSRSSCGPGLGLHEPREEGESRQPIQTRHIADY